MSVKTLKKKHVFYTDTLAPGEDPFSTNKVTGFSLNVPIIGTCKPTVVCGETCYFAKGPSTWTASLKKQHRLLNSIRENPAAAAERIVHFAKKKKLEFIRWQGGGDLFPEAIPCIDAVAKSLPDVAQWVVSRIPKLAASVIARPNVYVHFSVDQSSWKRLEEFRQLVPAGLQWHWSYQCDAGERPPSQSIAPVIFRDKYDPQGDRLGEHDCPLNASEDITGVCGACKRCFNGWATERRAKCEPLAK